MAATTRTNRSAVLRARVEPELVEAVEQLRVGNHISTESEMVRLLIRRGVLAVAQQGNEPATKQPQALNREQYAERAAALVEALSDLLARMESHDAEGAALLAEGLSKTMTAFTRDLKKRTKK